MIKYQQRNTEPLQNSYRYFLKRIVKSLSPKEVNDLCYISQEAYSAGLQNKTTFSGTILFKFFEQRMLITPDNLDFLRNCLQSINRLDLCKQIDDYTITCLNEPPLSYGEPLTQLHPPFEEPHPQSSYVGQCPQLSHVDLCSQSYVKPHPQPSYEEPPLQSSYMESHPPSYMEPHPPSYMEPHPQLSYVEPFPPPFNPEFCQPSHPSKLVLCINYTNGYCIFSKTHGCECYTDS